ncbi:MAG: ATP-binding protein [Desulfobulbaceae bacterium]|nr:ATP-binding protein [Desulfobulbaceae bacterium]
MFGQKTKQIFIGSLSRDAPDANLPLTWLLMLRWGALICQTLLVLAVYILFGTLPPLPIIILIILFGAGINLDFHFGFQKKHKTVPSDVFAVVMFLDLILLTALIYYTGGPMNPFTFLYLIHISLAAILMRPFWAWGLAVFTVSLYAMLFFLPDPTGAMGHHNHGAMSSGMPMPTDSLSEPLVQPDLALHLQGMWLAFVVTVFFVVFFVNKIQQDLEAHQQTLAELQMEKNRSEKLASLATLAAGAAHEFSTPLSTIAVAAGEMLSTLNMQEQCDPDLIADTRLIRNQVERCREILYQMSADAGEHLGESLRIFTIKELCNEVLLWFPDHVRTRIRLECAIKELSIRMPFRTLKRIIRGLIKNAIDASGEDAPVWVSCRKDDKYLYIEVRDQGQGMDAETMKKAIEPFFTTKEPGKGLGLGLFLTESAAERLGGSFQLASIPGKGTTAVISFSLSQIQYG